MPELPEVEVFRQYIEKTSLNKEITDVTIKGERIMQVDPEEFVQIVTGNTFFSTCRHGKNLFLELATSWLYMHFGMSGQLKYFKEFNQEPEHSRVLFTFENEYHLSYDCQRRFGKIDLIEDINDFITKKNLGPDALVIEESVFLDLFKGKRGYIKSALMNQKVLAGIGNIFSDEILFQAQIHPKTQVRLLNGDDLKKVYRIMKDVLETGIKCGAKEEKFPDNYIIPHRRKGGTCPVCGTDLERIHVSGRSAYFCPEHQSK